MFSLLSFCESEASLTPVKPSVGNVGGNEDRCSNDYLSCLETHPQVRRYQDTNCPGAWVCCPWPFCVWMCVWACSHAWWLNRRWLLLYARLLLWRRSLIASLLPPCLSFSFSRLSLSVLSPPFPVPHFPFHWLTTDFRSTAYGNLNQGNSGKISFSSTFCFSFCVPKSFWFVMEECVVMVDRVISCPRRVIVYLQNSSQGQLCTCYGKAPPHKAAMSPLLGYCVVEKYLEWGKWTSLPDVFPENKTKTVKMWTQRSQLLPETEQKEKKDYFIIYLKAKIAWMYN